MLKMVFSFCDYCFHFILLLLLIYSCIFGEIIFVAYFDIFGHYYYYFLFWFGAIFTYLNDGGQYKYGCFKWYKLLFVERQDERLVCEEIESSRLCYIQVGFYVGWTMGLWTTISVWFYSAIYIKDNVYNYIANETRAWTWWKTIESLYASKLGDNKL